MDARKMCTTSGEPVEQVRAEQTEETGQHQAYIVLCEDERNKGYVRPYRASYVHVGPTGPRFAVRTLTDDERTQHNVDGHVPYVVFEAYPESERPVTGRFWTQPQLDGVGKGCGAMTTMGRAIAETYARDPHFYGSTFCIVCDKHLPVGEFVWYGTTDRVGS